MGVIASVTRPFCATCTRARLSAEGQLYLCLFGVRGHDLRVLLRAGVDDEALAAHRPDGLGAPHRPLLGAPVRGDGRPAKVEMSHIGG